MDNKRIIEIAEDRIMSDLCVKWHFLDHVESYRILTDEEAEEKFKLYNEIQEFYKKLNKIK